MTPWSQARCPGARLDTPGAAVGPGPLAVEFPRQCSSGVGNEALYEQYKSKVGKNVIATNHMGFIQLKNTDSGCEWNSINMVDLGGSIPGMMKGKIASRQAKQAIGTINFIMTGEKPPE